MYIRKIAVAAGFATGAALALAPLASAAPVDPTLVTSTLDSEIASQNSLFEFEALLAGDSADVTKGGAGVFDTIPLSDVPKITDPADASQLTTLEYELYGVNPIAAGISGDSGPFSEFNGALTQFDNALNVEVYSAANGNALDTNLNDYLFNGTIQTVLATQGETTTQAFDTLYNQGIGDLSGFFQTDLSSLDIAVPAASTAAADPAAVTDINSTLTSEANSLNGIFDSEAALTGISSDDITPGTGVLPFDTIATADTNDIFNTLVFGAAGPSPDPGSYDVFNGALGEFDNAYNVELFSLLNSGDILPVADLIGTHADLLNGTVSEAITGFLQLGVSDLLGYF